MVKRTGLLVILGCAWSILACAKADEGFKPQSPPIKAIRRADGTLDDKSLCEWKGRKDRETQETSGPGATQKNVRRVWQVIGRGDDRHRVLVCREVDTNFDGIKDVVRRYNDKGESLHEESDSNYDGRIDTWLTFAKGHLVEVKIDNNHDSKPDEWKFYTEGQLARARRDRNLDGKPDVWEIYREGRLERMGVDIDGDERVDRWDHDTELRRRFEEAERKKDEEAAAAAAKKAAAEREAAEKADEAAEKADKPAEKADKPAEKADKPAEKSDKGAGAKPKGKQN